MHPIKELLKNYNKCFFCGSDELGQKVNYNFKNNQYIISLLKSKSFDLEKLNLNLELRECLNCNCYTFSKWFNEDYKNRIYNLQKHRMGWYKFFNTIFFYNKELMQNDAETYLEIKKEIGQIKNYLEIYCPFVGFLALFSIFKNEKDINKKLFNSNLINFFINLQKLIKRNVNSFSKKSVKEISIPDNYFFLEVEKIVGWSETCNAFGCNCRTISSRINWITKLNLDKLTSLDEKIDLLNLSNTLDHVKDPLILLKKIRPKVKNIFFHFHDIDGGPQHPFFITEKTITFIAHDLEFNIKKFSSNKILLIKK